MVADVGLSHDAIVKLTRILSDGFDPNVIESELEEATGALRAMVASSDGVQETGDRIGDLHHFSNTLFNCMRGGLFLRDHEVPTTDLRAFATTRHKELSTTQAQFFDSLPERISASELTEKASITDDPALRRWCLEYLPLRFGRRHGDPSRPWNRFSINTQDSDGNPILQYEGNWRDIFQNWEALSLSFPDFIEGMVARFVNASTFDGFNPYRITRDGIDWEAPDPEDPWATIGYWGDHQVAYLVRLLEQSIRVHPGQLEGLLDESVFSYADVPYRILSYEELVSDPWNTIAFDVERDRRTHERAARLGSDGQLLTDSEGDVLHVTLAEKLLVPALSKLSNLVPDGGVWMNTQRPEWNDANNALVGLGLSVVTACHLHRYLKTVRELLAAHDGDLHLSAEVAEWLLSLNHAFEEAGVPLAGMDATKRRHLFDQLGMAFEDYRTKVWKNGLSAPVQFSSAETLSFIDRSIAWVTATIQSNRRDDGLYHTYNLIDLKEKEQLGIDRLSLMLEGQVAALSSGVADSEEAAAIGEALFNSALYRDDQRSFMLYPVRELPSFLDRNAVSSEAIQSIPLLCELIEASEVKVLSVDPNGTGRFHGDIANAEDVNSALDELAKDPRWREAVSSDREAVLSLFEETFNHRAFTGRSGTMYGYEGIGCIYWHMTSKLLLAIQENEHAALRQGSDHAAQLTEIYRRVRAGLSASKTPAEYGAFPADPYSHTRGDGRARQPGMTGQVKEEVITRFGELGVHVEDGRVHFTPAQLREDDLSEGALKFTFCGAPIEFVRGQTGVRLHAADGSITELEGRRLDRQASADLLSRSGRWQRVQVGLD